MNSSNSDPEAYDEIHLDEYDAGKRLINDVDIKPNILKMKQLTRSYQGARRVEEKSKYMKQTSAIYHDTVKKIATKLKNYKQEMALKMVADEGMSMHYTSPVHNLLFRKDDHSDIADLLDRELYKISGVAGSGMRFHRGLSISERMFDMDLPEEMQMQ